MQQRIVNRAVLILVLIAISLLFLAVMKPFLLSIFIAALFAALFSPLYRKFLSLFGEREALASLATLLTILLFVVVPLSMVFGTVFSQAVDIAQTAKPWIVAQLSEPGMITENLSKLPFYEQLLPYREMLLNWVGNMTGSVSKWTIDAAQSVTTGTIKLLANVLIILYTMFFFFIDGDRLLYYLLYYLPLNDDDEKKLLARFTSVTRATLKGTAVIGILQGSLAGLALYFAGIPSALFWAVAMMFLSVVPGIGTAIVWIPAALYLVAGGEYITALLLVLFCAVVVGSVDNLLRPKLVGNDTQLHELLIFFSTLGGLILFGFMGFVIGPIIAALFVTIWELYGYEFSSWLPTTAFRPRKGEVPLPHHKLLADNETSAASETLAGNRAAGATPAKRSESSAGSDPSGPSSTSTPSNSPPTSGNKGDAEP
ncbi:MAG: AI-2E family transporter [Gammaproteobacteria bacterium]|nr:AI-2E family transporter [Gammaproteobacteria bacterium]